MNLTLALSASLCFLKQRRQDKCFCCNINIHYDVFHCDHIIAEANGGLTILSNLEPICKNCNFTMRTKNLIDFKNELTQFNNDLLFIESISNKINSNF